MRENCIVSLGVGLNFQFGLNRIKECIDKYKIDADYISFSEYPEWCVKHDDVPYAFKYYVIRHCFELGYKNVLYIDASIYPKNNLGRIWQILNSKGYFFVDNWHSIGMYCHDKFLKKIGMTRATSFTIKSLQGGYVGINMKFQKPMHWLNRMIYYSQDGISFVGCRHNDTKLCSKNKSVKGHRHDQIVGAFLANKIGLNDRYDCNNFFNIDRVSVKKNINKEIREFWWNKVNMSI